MTQVIDFLKIFWGERGGGGVVCFAFRFVLFLYLVGVFFHLFFLIVIFDFIGIKGCAGGRYTPETLNILV